MTFHSCLDLEPQDQLGGKNMWTSVNDYKQFANTFYSWTRDFSSVVYDGTHSDKRSDLITYQSYNEFSRGINSIPSSDANYTDNYKHIRRTNLLLQNAEAYAKPEDIKQYIGEAYFFRAYSYFDLLQLYGDVIITKKPLDITDPEMKVKRNDRSEVVDLIIDDTPEAITLSCFEPVRREIARIALEKLITDGRIHPARIEEMVEKARREVESEIKRTGERAVLDAGVHNIHPELVKLLGRLRYRTSYGQNVLDHSLEVSYIAGMMASELGLDPTIAKRAGLLHDIGKSIDHEVEGTHIQIGVDLAKKYKESDAVIHAIHAHHGDVEARTIVACLVQAADAISAARPGARRENVENYIKRLQKLEEVASSFDGVERTFAIQAGREVRVMVKPEIVNDERMIPLARDICKKIEEELEYPGQIKVNIIRESRASDFAK